MSVESPPAPAAPAWTHWEPDAAAALGEALCEKGPRVPTRPRGGGGGQIHVATAQGAALRGTGPGLTLPVSRQMMLASENADVWLSVGGPSLRSQT